MKALDVNPELSTLYLVIDLNYFALSSAMVLVG